MLQNIHVQNEMFVLYHQNDTENNQNGYCTTLKCGHSRVYCSASSGSVVGMRWPSPEQYLEYLQKEYN